MKMSSLLVIVLLSVSGIVQTKAYTSLYCSSSSRCGAKTVYCPEECPDSESNNRKEKVCRIDCGSPKCKSECKRVKPDCNSPGSACYDPRFIGGDGVVFYFHGKSNQHFSLVSDKNIQINARFIGHRPAGRTRDFTWIQALGLLFNSHTFSVDAIRSAIWDNEIDHLKFSYDGEDILIPAGHLSTWNSPVESVKVERTTSKNSVLVTIPGIVEIMVNVVPVTKQDDRIHSYKVPSDDCFAHLEVQFRFFALSSNVEGVLGRTYQPDFENPAKPGVAMAVVGGEDKYRTSSLLSQECETCVFSPTQDKENDSSIIMEYGTLDCSGSLSSGNGIVCKK
ncbi:Late embryogenesis abundant protein-related [Heracleum sosnowskyi]|uniref:Late embryogenesis abundant protein-related n=1 Tax=Heracleum sosnowskyi TaxID=360622 RepID=A0AAD8N0M5_9APIA|nr:Late embryogenesis abundant protein-related [Heracleum sosnowskyi]